MSKEKARAHFLGMPGHKKLNCGQTIIHSFQDKFSLAGDLVGRFEGYGGGRAPEGLCGALYAAKVILEERHPEKFKACQETFKAHASSTKCKEIRSSCKLTCLGCVEKVAQSLEEA